MVTPSLVMVGAPNFLSMTTLRPLGPIVTLTVSASLLTPRSRARRASSSNFRIFAMELNCSSQKQELRPCRPASYVAGGQGRRTEANVGELLLDDREHVASREDEVLLAVVLHLGAAVLAVQHDVAGLDVERQTLAVLEAARAHGQDDALLGLLLGGVRDDQARGGGLLGVERLDHDAVLERLDGNLGAGGRHDPTSPFVDLTGLTV